MYSSVDAFMYVQKTCFCVVADLTERRFCYDKIRELKFVELSVYVYKRLPENLVQTAFFLFEIFNYKVHAYMYVQKTFFCAVADLNKRRFCYDETRELKFIKLSVYVYTKTR